MKSISRAMILAAGKSTRLMPLSRLIPKPALPLLGRPLVHHALEWLERFDIHDVGVNLHYRPETVQTAVTSYRHPEFSVRFSTESPEILLTAGALSPLRDFFQDTGTFVMMNGKVFTDIDLSEALAHHRKQGNIATLLLLPNRKREVYSHVQLTKDGVVQEFVPFAQTDNETSLNVFTGIHILEPEILNSIPDHQPYDTVGDLYPRLIQRGLPVGGFVTQGVWLEFSTLQRYLDYSTYLLEKAEMNCWTEPGLQMDSSVRCQTVTFHGPVVIEDHARLSRCVLLGENEIGSRSILRNCIVGPGARVPADTALDGVLIMPPDESDEGAGSLMGEEGTSETDSAAVCRVFPLTGPGGRTACWM